MKKYNFDLDLKNRNSLSLIIERIKPNSLVLEFGPANGRLTKYLKETMKCRVFCVEIDEKAANDAKSYSEKMLIDNIENYNWCDEFKNIKFDYIIFADVLEHLYNPKEVLEKSKDFLHEEGSILLSIPNIAHNAVIMELFNGKFTYRPIGLLDDTHIRFFTKETLDELASSVNLFKVYETATYEKPQNTEFNYSYDDLNQDVALFLQELNYGEVYQFIYELKLTSDELLSDINLVNKDNSILKLYMDIGDNFNEKDIINIAFQKNQKYIFDLSKYKNIKALRFDPLNNYIILKINSIVINDSYSKLFFSNAFYIENNIYYFNTKDPQINVDITNISKMDKIIFDIEYVAIGIFAQEQFNNIYTKILKEKEQQIQEKEQQIQEKEQQIQEKEQQIQYWHDLAHSLRVKNRIKRVIKKIIPKKIWKILQYLKHNPNSIKLGLFILKTQGVKALFTKINKVENLSENKLTNSYTYNEAIFTQDIKQEIELFKKMPLISIIMPVYNVDIKWLDFAVKSVENQWYENWELCIVDDKSTKQATINYLKNIKNSKIKVEFSEKNLNISGASNRAIEMSTGEYIALLDNDDELTPNALYEVVKVINETDAEFIYSDEDFLTIDGTCVNPHFKPDFSPHLLMSHNYITHFSCFKRELLDKVGLFNTKYDGSQDYDLFLRLTEKTNKIHHIPKVLYHWRMIETSTSSNNSQIKPEAVDRGKRALESTLQRRGIKGEVLNANLNHYFRIKYDLLSNPLVSIIIPFKDKPELLTVCVESILQKTRYKNFEIIGISNNSTQEETFNELNRLKKLDSKVTFYEYNVPFNYSKINNYGVNNYAKGKHVILLNNDIEVITPNWIEEMLMYSQQEDIGCVGAKLYYPNDTIQHAGIIMGLGGYADHSHKHYKREDYGYFNRLNVVQNISTLTAACVMIKKELYQELGGLDEVDFGVAYNDVDFGLRVMKKGYLNIFTPYCEMYHHESITRGYEDTPEKIARFQVEKDNLFNRHRDILEKGDPYYNPNLTLDRGDFSLR